MADLPDTYAVATGFVAARPTEVWARLRDLEQWPAIFPEWISAIELDDDRFHVTGPNREKYDFYAHSDGEQRELDVEVIDELGSADTLKLRLLEIPGGTLVIAAHGRLAGTSDAAWQQKRDGVASGLSALSLD